MCDVCVFGNSVGVFIGRADWDKKKDILKAQSVNPATIPAQGS